MSENKTQPHARHLQGLDAKARLSYLLEYVPRYELVPHSDTDKGCFACEDGRWSAFDNTTNECFVEEFDTEAEAKAWLAGKEEEPQPEPKPAQPPAPADWRTLPLDEIAVRFENEFEYWQVKHKLDKMGITRSDGRRLFEIPNDYYFDVHPYFLVSGLIVKQAGEHYIGTRTIVAAQDFLAEPIPGFAKLEIGDKYFRIYKPDSESSEISLDGWFKYDEDYANLALGNVFFTKEEAEANRPYVQARVDRLKGKEVAS